MRERRKRRSSKSKNNLEISITMESCGWVVLNPIQQKAKTEFQDLVLIFSPEITFIRFEEEEEEEEEERGSGQKRGG